MSLYWTLAVIVTLMHSLTGMPADKIKYSHISNSLDKLESVNCSEPNSTFYTPSTDTECIVKSLNCSIQELEVIKSECFKENSTSAQQTSRTAAMIQKKLNLTNNTLEERFENCFCGNKLEEKSYKEFLVNLRTLLQKLYSS